MDTTDLTPPPARAAGLGAAARAVLREAGIGIALIVLIAVFSVTSQHFLSASNLTNVLTQVTINLVLSIGMTFVILIGGIDLSVGSVLAFCAVVAGTVMTLPGLDPAVGVILAILSAVAAGVAFGLLNGFISAFWSIPSFIVTLGTLNIARGAALQVTNANTIYSFPVAFNAFGSQTIHGVPVLFLIALVLVAIAWFVLMKTVFGRVLYGIGNNEEAVRLAGHNVFAYKVAAFAIGGATVGIGAIIYMARLNIASPIIGIGFELNAIAAVIIGGTSLSGGRGSVIGTLLGACIIGVLANGLILLGLNDFMRQMITGLVIILAIVLDKYRERLSKT
ncbi:ABC transporter permease [Bradyrhizobium sp. U87765 SZCCT0131]|uniref:ABC transporter permease n=1 Tax=unclassified Bradyrhizobium TaxID=2631580 RepID=UPI001BA6780C|nr:MULTISPECIES: ABC transporter permease [unclassified Bradyrhizobium]MBR1222428.1 ABC transporter permease [Bradyrhizobium sp. U87765 SZCCT0131]MBR1264088.1 ABC transporter permease [Bradyrhizobium sp. U87765 SZCCT0134]MBR1308129.1 ABC transporter permease [Bradyrhizobium sp. U87765 SZCCT0110]MBR1320338.1 ABC transporter permease [Bradyrhizobium sp. U87765 SZCCT0109]MBR1348549.1 ABC transporter permease [Bradyrhizobium sp. U87765 SZCCT0048]